jgi:hypothetical protein
MEWCRNTLQNAARAQTGLEDFGPPDYIAGLDELVRGYAGAELNVQQATAAQTALVDLLAARLRSQQRLNTEVVAPVERPWFILGMPRSGTTALHRLLCADPGAQGLEYWLGMHPQPRPPRGDWARNADYLRERAALETLQRCDPGLFALHPIDVNEVDECRLLLMQSFTNHSFSFNAPLPSYEAWLWQHDLRPSYARFRQLLGLIDGGAHRRWVLKDPSHLASLDALLAEFPDLRVIYTWRDPVQFIPSICTLVYGWRRLSDPNVDPHEVGLQALAIWSRSAAELARWRRANPDIPWSTVELPALQKNPMAVVESIYDALGESLSEAGRTAMSDLLAAGLRGGRHGRTPEPEEFGLSRQSIKAAFADFL